MARKMVARARASLAFGPELLQALLTWYELRSDGDRPVAVFSLGCDKAESPICVYDHRPDVCRAVAAFEEDPGKENAQALIDAFSADALVKIVTSRIAGADRPAINLHPLQAGYSVDHVFSGSLRKPHTELSAPGLWTVQLPAGRRRKACFALRELPRPSEQDGAERPAEPAPAKPNQPAVPDDPADIYALMGIRSVVFDRPSSNPRRR